MYRTLRTTGHLFIVATVFHSTVFAQNNTSYALEFIPRDKSDYDLWVEPAEGFALVGNTVISVNKQEAKKALKLTIYRYERGSGTALGSTQAEISGELPKFERMLCMGNKAFVVYSTRTSDALVMLHALPFDPASGTVATSSPHELARLQFNKAKLEVAISDFRPKIRLIVAPSGGRVLVYHDDMRSAEKDRSRVVSMWTYDSDMRPVWNTVYNTQQSFIEDRFTNVVLTDVGDVYALNITDNAKDARYAPGLSGNHRVVRWRSGEIHHERIVLPEPWSTQDACMVVADGVVKVGGWYADAKEPEKRKSVGAFEMRLDLDLVPKGEARLFPMKSAYEEAMNQPMLLHRSDGGSYLLNVHNVQQGLKILHERQFALSIGPSGEQEWFTEVPRTGETRYGYYAYTALCGQGGLAVLFQDTRSNLERYGKGLSPEMDQKGEAAEIVVTFDRNGAAAFSALAPSGHRVYLKEGDKGQEAAPSLLSGYKKLEGSKDGTSLIVILSPQ